jgi:hypothetical protein
VDDGSDPPVRVADLEVPSAVREKLTVIRQEGEGYIVGRNATVRRAANPFVLLLDDDASLIDAAALRDAQAVLLGNHRVAAVAFAQAERDGRPWPEGMQPSTAAVPSFVPSFIGFAHLLRRDTFVSLGGYRESFHYYGEEKDYCLRAFAAGYRVAYLPAARVIHTPDPAGRSTTKYLRYVIRNDCLFGLYNEPFLDGLAGVPIRLARFFAMQPPGSHDPGGMLWILRGIVRALPDVVRHRTPVSRRTLRAWRAMRHEPEPLGARDAAGEAA